MYWNHKLLIIMSFKLFVLVPCSLVAGVVALEVLLRAAIAAAAAVVAVVPTYLYVGSLSWVATVVALDVLLPVDAAAVAAVATVLEMIGFGQG
ncbi:hypothetical protein CRG98_008952 [Punica granatum]|uniref:Uncharacterized protein n=1 Tax=Punica granatum TaxID=22663 RepID=A0A2I0KQK2_PUNGR|nr:hypothetical protein CRG98_008952 [Punica granatum]